MHIAVDNYSMFMFKKVDTKNLGQRFVGLLSVAEQ